MLWFLDNTSPLVFILLSSADSPALRMSPRLIVTVVRHLPAQGARIAHHPLSKFSSSVRGPVLCKTRSFASTILIGLSASKSIVWGFSSKNCFTGSPQWNYFDSAYTMVSPLLRYVGSNGSFFFIKVHAITRSFAASLTRIFVPIPFSLCLPLSLLV